MPREFSKEEIRRSLTGKEGTLFYGVEPHILDTLIARGEMVTFRKDDIIFSVNDPAGWFYVLIDGKVVTQLHNVSVRALAVGEVGGLTSSLDPPSLKASGAHLRRSMTHAVVSDEATILKVPQALYPELLRDPKFAVHVAAYLHMRLRSKTSVIALLTGNPGHKAVVEKHPLDMRIAVFDTKPYDRRYLSAAFEPYEQKTPRLHLRFLEAKLSEQTVALAVGSDAVCIFVNDVCNAAVLLGLRSAGVRLVLLRNAGFNNVDRKKAEALGITVLRVPAYSPNAVAEHAFALLATVNRKTHRAYNRVRDGNFMLSGLEGRDLNGLTVGVCGCGKIGRCFISIAKGIGMKVLVYDKATTAEAAEKMGAEKVEDLLAMLKQCDVLSLHLPLTKSTRHLINADAIKALPKGAIVLNTSRGPIIDARALLKGLISGHLGGAGLDVYEDESAYFFEDRSSKPIDDDVLARLVNLPNCVVTSHQAFLTDKALTAISQTTLENALAYQKVKAGKSKLEDLSNAVVIGKPDSAPASKL